MAKKKYMIAIVHSVSKDGIVRAMVRRNYVLETVSGQHPELKIKDRIVVYREANNPYLKFVGKEVKS